MIDAKQLNLAAQVIAEIIRQSPGDEVRGKVKLFKAFYFAHLNFMRANHSLLSEWPIVKMPNGPGIGSFEKLLEELKSQRVIEVHAIHIGPYPSERFVATGKSLPGEQLSPEAIKAIRSAIEMTVGRTAAQLSEWTHAYSKSWNEAKVGSELSIYVDLLSDDTHAAIQTHLAELDASLTDAWQD
jgi:hypothetical protein